MDTKMNNTSANKLTRLGAYFITLALGFALGFFTGNRQAPQSEAATPAAVSITQSSTEATQDGSESTDATKADSTVADTSTPTDGDATPSDSGSTTVAPTRGPTIEEDGWYSTKDEVALYIHTYGHLPGNYISKTKARRRGWVPSKGNLDQVCPGMSIGGSEYYNFEDELPDKQGRRWTECDINYQGGYRGPERIVFSNDGLIFYTGDHYDNFEQLY